MKFVEKSYQSHQNWYQKVGREEQLSMLQNAHKRDYSTCYNYMLPILNPNDRWFTVGDCYGTDAGWISPHCKEATATDIRAALMELAQQEGLITSFSKQNAESMTFDDDSFDFAYCCETFHHFPRPYIAVYEMLRCAKKGVVIDEPADPYLQMPFFMLACNFFDTKKNPKRSAALWKNRFSFETVGNYVYKTSQREFEKIAMGAGLPAIAFYRYNFLRKENGGKEKAKEFFIKALTMLRIIPYKRLAVILFKELPDNETKKALRKLGYHYYELPENPYLTAI
jgi:ubiquinone/menaquinone biosynthesis C-methylase UbiE